jgi:hypothetical protein
MRPSVLRPAVLLLVVASASCRSLRGTEPSTVSTSQLVASAYWFRGTPRSLEAVTQGDLTVATPLAFGGTLSFVTWYNLQLTNETGDAIFPDGQGGEATQIDLLLEYTRLVGRTRLTAGGVGYTFPEIGPSTREAYASATVDALGLTHACSAYYDVGELDDFYVSYRATRTVALDERWSAAVSLQLGYMGDDQAAGTFGREHAGFSDVLLSGSLGYAFDANASAFLRIAGVTVPDDELSDALDERDLDDGGVWVTVGAAWGL